MFRSRYSSIFYEIIISKRILYYLVFFFFCLGKRFADLVMLIAISWVLREFTIHSLHKQEDLKVLPKTILEPVHGLQVKLTPRR